jgi:hypothetical protein
MPRVVDGERGFCRKKRIAWRGEPLGSYRELKAES